MKKIVFSNDFLFHGQDASLAVWHDEVFALLSVAIESATGTRPVSICEVRDKSGECFSRNKFFELSGITDVAPSYNIYDMSRITDDSWRYLKGFFGEDTLFVASEFGMDLREKMTAMGIPYVNFWFHPYKLLNDAFFLVGTNSEAVFKALERYKVPQARLRFYGEYYVHLARRKRFVDKLPIEDGCCVFIGQTSKDQSVADGGTFLNISDYPEKIAELARQYSRIYYVPHPCAKAMPCEEVERFLAETPEVEVLEGVPTYYLLASPKVKKVVALSSSVVYEAQFFGKEAEYLFRPLFEIDGEFSLNTFVSVYQDYFSAAFWRDILSALGETVAAGDTRDETIMARDAEMFRDLLGIPFGYRYLGRLERDEDRLTAHDRVYAKLSGKFAELAASHGQLAARYDQLAASRDRLAASHRNLAAGHEILVSHHEGLARAHAALDAAHADLNARVVDQERRLAALENNFFVRNIMRVCRFFRKSRQDR